MFYSWNAQRCKDCCVTFYDSLHLKTEIAADWCGHVNNFISIIYIHHHCTNEIKALTHCVPLAADTMCCCVFPFVIVTAVSQHWDQWQHIYKPPHPLIYTHLHPLLLHFALLHTKAVPRTYGLALISSFCTTYFLLPYRKVLFVTLASANSLYVYNLLGNKPDLLQHKTW